MSSRFRTGQAVFAKRSWQLVLRSLAECALEFAFDERRKAGPQQIQRLADALMIRDGHRNSSSEVPDFHVAPMFFEVRGDQAPVAVIRFILAAQQAAVGDHVSRDLVLNLSVPDQL